MFYRAGLLSVPLEEGEALARSVGYDGEVAHAAPVGEAVPLARLDPHRQVAADAQTVLPVVAIVGDVGDLGPGPDRLRLLALRRPRAGAASRPCAARADRR